MKNARTGWNASRLASERQLSKRKVYAPVGAFPDPTAPRFSSDPHCGVCKYHVCNCEQRYVNAPRPAPTPVTGRYNPETGNIDIVPVTQPMTVFQAFQMRPRHEWFECEARLSTCESDIALLGMQDKRHNPPHLLYERVPVSMLIEAVVEITWKRLKYAADKWFAAQQEKP